MITCDAHVDTLWQLSGLAQKNQATVTKERMQFGGLDKAVFALYLSDAVIDAQRDQGDVNILLGRAIATWKQHFSDQYLALEGARCLGVLNPEELLGHLAHAGIKYVTLVHNKNNIFATSSTDVSAACGLTRFGQKLIRKAEELKVLVDVSHASDKTLGDILTFTSKPLIASHSGCRARTEHIRNLTDQQIIRIALTGGMVCIPMARRFVDTMSGVAEHVDHVCQVTGSIASVGIGSDLDGAEMVTGVGGPEHWSTVVIGQLSQRGYGDEQLAAVAGGNLLRLFGETTT